MSGHPEEMMSLYQREPEVIKLLYGKEISNNNLKGFIAPNNTSQYILCFM